MILCFLANILVLSLPSSTTFANQLQDYQIAKPGCPDECGGVKIPFPFGLKDGCYLNNDTTYKIRCDTTNLQPVPLLGTFKVLSINLSDHGIRVSSRVAYQCYSKSGKPVTSTDNSTYELDVTPFNISATRNKFVAVGCDTTASVQDSESPGLDLTGCMTSCLNLQSVSNSGACSGGGCCETAIFDTMSKPQVRVGSFNNRTKVEGYNPCSFAFVGEVGSYKFSVANLTASVTDCGKIRVPVVYDWSLHSSYRSCSDAEKSGNGALLCGSNTKCVDDGNGRWGYRCQCLEGFAGNPYLSQGCQDIDECKDFSLNQCSIDVFCSEGEDLNQCQKQQLCVNKIGGYDCLCPGGKVGNGTTSSPCIDAPATSGASKLILGLSIGMVTIIGLILFYGLSKLMKRSKEIQAREGNFRRNGGLLLQQKMSANEGAIERTKVFTRIELVKATDNFNDNRVLGRGGQGTVYKGMLADGTIVAVKKSKKVDENQLAQFINEVVILSQINHRNVVKLFGCCLETEVPLLVYEFVSNGTLYQHIHDPSEDFHVTWKLRFQIAVQCAGALAYLHSSCSSPVYHRDIKSSNILLDEKYKAKISDFGTSKTISVDQTHVTTRVQGTFGYLDPEFFQSNQFSEKSDVYSFGVVLLELLTSKKPVFIDEYEEPRGLATEFLQLMESRPGELHGILDAQVLEECSREEIEALANLAKRCLSLSGKHRPKMREVAMTLEMVKSQHDQAGDSAIEQRTERQDVWADRISMTNEGALSTSSTSTCIESSYSIDLQAILVNSN